MKITKRWQLKYIGITEDEIIQNGKIWMRQEKYKPWGPKIVHRKKFNGTISTVTQKKPKLIHKKRDFREYYLPRPGQRKI